MAIERGSIRCEAVLDAGADPTQQVDGVGVLELAAEKQFKSAEALLREKMPTRKAASSPATSSASASSQGATGAASQEGDDDEAPPVPAGGLGLVVPGKKDKRKAAPELAAITEQDEGEEGEDAEGAEERKEGDGEEAEEEAEEEGEEEVEGEGRRA